MFGLFKRKKKPQLTQEQIAARKAAQIRGYRECYTIALNNCRYIKAAINLHNSVAKTAKGESAAETKRKRAHSRKMAEWYQKKLPEEQFWVQHYARLGGIKISS
jgi:hypothetical protein